ncbi:MAG: hypothetical protein ACI82F_004685 [Planctomycetota bacterium]|jgi:hypothetical protein
MHRTLISTSLALLTLASCGGSGVVNRGDEAVLMEVCGTAPVRPSLSPLAAEAFDVLLATERFTDSAIYAGGVTPVEVIALRILLGQPQAPEVLRELAASHSMATKLYGLCGLYYVDPAMFAVHVERLRSSGAVIEFQTGCSTLTDYPVSDLLDLGSERAVRLDSRELSVRAWKALDVARFSLGYDIVGGGYPNLFLEEAGYGEVRSQGLDKGAH